MEVGVTEAQSRDVSTVLGGLLELALGGREVRATKCGQLSRVFLRRKARHSWGEKQG